jgi:hypothetical protein
VRAEIEIGPSDGDWVEVTNHRPPTESEEQTNQAPWIPFDGSEQVILGDVSVLTEGTAVKVASPSSDTKVARATRESKVATSTSAELATTHSSNVRVDAAAR